MIQPSKDRRQCYGYMMVSCLAAVRRWLEAGLAMDQLAVRSIG
jgi:hypothetical protein